MSKVKRRIAGLMAAALLAASVAPAAAFAGGYCPPPEPPKKEKCNAGRGNGSEGCDPGNSSTSPTGDAGQNQGGDEGGPIRGGTGAP